MSLSLPPAVSAYFEASNGSAAAPAGHCFTQDAIVVDEGKQYQGRDAIEAWQREARSKFEYTVEPVGVTRDGERLTVTASVVGNFPGSPVRLDHVFVLAGGKIRSLEIG